MSRLSAFKPFIYNQNAPMLKWKAAKARVATGTGRGRLAVVGDSTSKGVVAGPSGTLDGAQLTCWPTKMANYLTRDHGVKCSNESAWCGLGVVGDTGIDSAAEQMAYDTRLSIGASWEAENGGNYTFGAAPFIDQSGSTDWSFTPTIPTDRCTFVYPANPTLGSFNIRVDSGANTTISEDAAAAYLQNTVSTTLGSHTYTVARVSGFVYYYGFIAWDSSIPAIDVLNSGISGSTTTDWNNATNPFNTRSAITNIGADLTLINLGINDYEGGSITAATYYSNLNAIVAAAKVNGDAILIMPTSSNFSATETVKQTYRNQLTALCDLHNIMMIDLQLYCRSFALQDTMGRMSDLVHPNMILHDDMGRFMASILARI
jgi:lysophospholipase L1-like esterase